MNDLRFFAGLLAALGCSLVHAQVARAGSPPSCTPAWTSSVGLASQATIFALEVFDDGRGGGPAVYAGGSLPGFVARWTGSQWQPIANGPNGEVRALCAFDDGSGPALFIAGEFSTVNGIPAQGVAKWDGQQWISIGDLNAIVTSLCVFDDGTGPALIVGGGFTSAAGVPASRIAKWDGKTWSALGLGTSSHVNAMAVFDDGRGPPTRGPALFAGGFFTSAGGAPANHIARWDGRAWSALGAGTDAQVRAIAVFDDGSGPALYAGGFFTSAGGTPASRIARWDGEQWSAVGGGMDSIVHTLITFDDNTGAGAALYAGGDFIFAGGQPASRVARWDGGNWTALNSGANGGIMASAVLIEDNTPTLWVGGTFGMAGGVQSRSIARWAGCEFPNQIPGDVNSDGTVNVDDLVLVILNWGPCPTPPAPCPADVNNSGAVDVDDLIMVILNWG